jgi:hypothetical protein
VTSGLQLTVEIVEVMEARWGEAMLADPSVNPVWHMGNVAFTFYLPLHNCGYWLILGDAPNDNPWLPETNGSSSVAEIKG